MVEPNAWLIGLNPDHPATVCIVHRRDDRHRARVPLQSRRPPHDDPDLRRGPPVHHLLDSDRRNQRSRSDHRTNRDRRGLHGRRRDPARKAGRGARDHDRCEYLGRGPALGIGIGAVTCSCRDRDRDYCSLCGPALPWVERRIVRTVSRVYTITTHIDPDRRPQLVATFQRCSLQAHCDSQANATTSCRRSGT